MKSELPPLPVGYENRMKRFAEEINLVSAGLDWRKRKVLLHPAAAQAWYAMKSTAEKDKIELLLVSGFRSVARQEEIIEKKLARGIPWEEILRQNTYPGFSEHHTGRAVDIASPDGPELVEAFEATPEFRWLSGQAGRFGFFLSYPRNNPHGIAYEPWHWFYKKSV